MAFATTNVIGANGFTGNEVARAFVRAGYGTYGLVSQHSVYSTLASTEMIPILGSTSDTPFLHNF